MTPRQVAGIVQASPELFTTATQQLPHVMKMGTGGSNTSNAATTGGGGLSVVSAPAPMSQRPDLTSNSQVNTRTVLTQNGGSFEKLGLQKGGAKHMRAASNNLRMKQMELTGNHAVVFS